MTKSPLPLRERVRVRGKFSQATLEVDPSPVALRHPLPQGERKGRLKSAFTLAEVLITLGIIGVVASMTLPSLVQKYKERELITGVKKVYSDVNNAIMKAQSDFGVIGDISVLFDPSNTAQQTAKNFLKYFNGAKFCERSSSKGCSQYYYDVKYSHFYSGNDGKGTTWTAKNWLPAIILNNGAILYITQRNNENCYAEESYTVKDEYGRPILDENGNEQVRTNYVTLCGTIVMDVNGTKRPNRYGEDVYSIMIYKDKVSPSYQSWTGSESFKSILSGKDKLIYKEYKEGESMED